MSRYLDFLAVAVLTVVAVFVVVLFGGITLMMLGVLQ